jgi:DNA-binding Lrp family transcriptional regulator
MLNSQDLELITQLEDNGRTSYEKLSQVLGVSISTVAKRIDNLLTNVYLDN